MAERDLAQLLTALSPTLDETRYGFACIQAEQIPASLAALALGSFRETEGITVIAPVAALNKAHVSIDGEYTCITLSVHSSLAAVGLTARVTTVLADAGISANVVAAFYHDHIFVPAEHALRAMTVLQDLSSNHRD